jgi:citrate lyase subunit beta/citryl-CoA lyase
LVYPPRIAVRNSVFSPSPTAVASAQRVNAVFAEPENARKGAVNLDGAMVERLHLAQAERILALDAAIQAAGNE